MISWPYHIWPCIGFYGKASHSRQSTNTTHGRANGLMKTWMIGDPISRHLSSRNVNNSVVSAWCIRKSGTSPRRRFADNLSCGIPGMGFGFAARYKNSTASTTNNHHWILPRHYVLIVDMLLSEWTGEVLLHVLHRLDGTSNLTLMATGALVLILGLAATWWPREPRLPNVPVLRLSALGGKAGMTEDIAAFVRNGKDVMQIGYDKYSRHGRNFLMQTPWRLMLVVAPKFIPEIVWAPDDKLDNQPSHDEILQTRYTMRSSLMLDQYYLEVVQKQLTRNLGRSRDEAKNAFRWRIGQPADWKDIGMYDAAFQITTRTANRFFFGATLASDLEFLQLSIDYSSTVFGGAAIIRNFHPLVDYFQFLKHFIVAWRTGIYKQQALARSKLGPVLRSRIAQQQRQEKSTASDAIQWVLDITPSEKRDVDLLVLRLMHLTIVAVHTSSVSYLDCMNELAARPEIHEELREEIRQVFAKEDGQWRKQTLSKLVKLDSFMRETVRFNTNGAGQLDRVATSDVTLSDGTLIPRGTYITTPAVAMNEDDAYWDDPAVFDPWRFCRKRAQPGQETQHSFVNTAPSYLHFG
nr:cytochrome p450 monooxygenase [Quercus suber]POE94733.1 cytochrome p450 monooxygenase [Quercus suber]